jgi:hypothetical protein
MAAHEAKKQAHAPCGLFKVYLRTQGLHQCLRIPYNAPHPEKPQHGVGYPSCLCDEAQAPMHPGKGAFERFGGIPSGHEWPTR